MLKRIAAVVGSLALFVLLGAALSGCASSAPSIDTDLDQQIALRDQQIESLKSEIEAERSAAEQARRDAEAAAERARAAERTSGQSSDAEVTLLPPDAQPGECYARVLVPEQYETTTERVLASEASFRIETVPARYENAEERIVKKEASERLEIVPATYEWVEERVLVKAASAKLVEVPAVYENVSEEVLVSPARTYWKKGRGVVEKIDNTTGEVMCLVEEPAVYRTVTKRVVKTPATTKEITIPAEYKTVKRQVEKTPASTRTISIPAEYETIQVRKLVEPAKEQRIEIPAEYKTVNKTAMTEESYLEWRPVVCETNMTTGGVRELQQALKNAGHDPGPIDGIYGKLTQAAVESFQKEKGLATGGLTYPTVEALGVQFRSSAVM